MPLSEEQIIDRLLVQVRDPLVAFPRCHDFDHTMRVLNNARRLAKVEGGHRLVIECAALLHDIGRKIELADNGRTCHAAVGAAQAPAILRQAGLRNPMLIERIVECVASHRFRGSPQASPPTTIEAKIIFDADKLDSMGAIGIGRAFHFAGRIGARVHNRENEALNGESYGLEDSAFREYLVKLRHLAGVLLTAEGRRLGAGRHLFMEEFFKRLTREVDGHDLA